MTSNVAAVLLLFPCVVGVMTVLAVFGIFEDPLNIWFWALLALPVLGNYGVWCWWRKTLSTSDDEVLLGLSISIWRVLIVIAWLIGLVAGIVTIP